MFCGMSVVDIRIEAAPDLSQREEFHCASPILIKRKLTNQGIKQYNYNDKEANSLLKETLLSKMREAGIKKTLLWKYTLTHLSPRKSLS